MGETRGGTEGVVEEPINNLSMKLPWFESFRLWGL